jgi:AraC family transcriptional regulator of adaptative response/methylated-DNA-[protein]-cysteine methyltransferase
MNKQREAEKLAIATLSDPRWQSVANRSHAADGDFFYSVRTTGVYCRPSCAARLARPENVAFHRTTQDAEKAGFRACKRCRPSGPSIAEDNAAVIAKVCRLIERSEKSPSLKKLSRLAGMSVFHLHRTFKAITGLTPRAYATAHRSNRVRKTLSNSASVTGAIYDAGFNSNSRFYESSNEVLGMTPTNFRDGGANTAIHFAIGECSLGSILVAKSERGVCAVLIGDDPHLLALDLQDQFPKATLIGNESGYEDMVAKVVGLIEKPALGLDLPLDIRGTAFQQRVWSALQQIPIVFPIQVAILLSEPQRDFTGGEFVLTEQRPRMQSRPEVVPLRQGDAVAFAVHHRPVQGTRGTYRVNLRHGVSRLRTGQRHTVGIIFHDAN